MIPPVETLAPWLDVAGLSVFAASGALVAARRRLDIVGAGFFAILTATGGGTLRDLLIGAPVFWMRDATPIVLCVAVAGVVWLVPPRRWPGRSLDWLDAAGLSAYAVYGALKALRFGIAPVSAVAAGVITACLGGIVRDMVAGMPSVLLRHELYVTAALAAAAGSVALVVAGVANPWPGIAGVAAGFALRAGAIRRGWTLPPHAGG